ncbi:MAG: type II secretion system F family protein [Candidatus Diapherotrites archaeon]
MNSTMIPFNPFPPNVLIALSKRFRGMGAKVASAFPYLKIELKQAEIDLRAEEYGAIIFVLSAFYFVMPVLIFYVLATRFSPENALPLSLTIGAIFSFLVILQLSLYPKMKIKKKLRNLEQNLVFALRTILVEIKSGVSLFDSVNMIALGNYGAVSEEFKKAVDAINTGTNEETALEDMAARNPSLFFRRTVWQLVSGLRAGADVSVVIGALVDMLIKEQKNQVVQYGSDLRMLSLVYMMLGVIIPALGLTFLIILASFPQINVTEMLFWGMLGGIIIAQFMYLGIIKSKRPTLLGS